MFAGDDEGLGLGGPGEAVEDVLIGVLGVEGLAGLGKKVAQVGPAGDFAAGGVDPVEGVGVPSVGVKPAVDVFELVEVVDGAVFVGHLDAVGLLEGGGVDEIDIGAAVVGDQVGSVVGHPPAIVRPAEVLFGLQVGEVVDKYLVFLVGELVEVVAQYRYTLAEVLLAQFLLGQQLSVRQAVSGEGGFPIVAFAFVEDGVVYLEAFGKGTGVVRQDVDHLVGDSRDRGGGCGRGSLGFFVVVASGQCQQEGKEG